ncbi:MAG: MOSC N-terminal beta barrel domain-containing protein [Chitinophagaceae bacterium]
MTYFSAMLIVSHLYIYPVKSLGGISVSAGNVTSRGLEYDRRMMLTDHNNQFITQRELPQLALLQPAFVDGGITVRLKKNPADTLFIPFKPDTTENVAVKVWDDPCTATVYGSCINEWFSRVLGLQCRLVMMPDDSKRYVDKRYAHNNEITSFADDYPLLLIGQASLDDLNARLAEPIPMDRFRPNIVFTGGGPFIEDEMKKFTINTIEFAVVKPCRRCVITTIDQEEGSKSNEPLKTLATYRMKNNKVLFGQNLLHNGHGTIRVGDRIDVQTYQSAAI